MFSALRNRRGWVLFLGAFLAVVILSLSAVSLQSAMGDIFERTDYKVYPTAQDPRDFFGRVYQKIRISQYKRSRPEDLENASQLAGFQIRAPMQLPQGWEPNQTTDTSLTGAHSYEVDINFTEARRLLEERGLSYASLPGDLDSASVSVEVLPSVVIHDSRGDMWFTLIQGRPPRVSETPSIDQQLLDQLAELGLQYLGLTPAEASQVTARMGWSWFLLIPPADMDAAEPVWIDGQRGVFLYTTQPGVDHKALLWENNGVLYGLYGNLPGNDLMDMAVSLE